MNNSGKIALIFASGVACGAMGMFLALKNKYQKAYNDAMNALAEREKQVNAAFNDMKQGATIAEAAEKNDISEAEVKPTVNYVPRYEKPEPEELLKKIQAAEEAGYLPEDSQEAKAVVKTVKNYPYVIPPDEAGEIAGYEQIDLRYFADGVLTNEDEEIIENWVDLIGEEALHSFGEYEEDAVYVRNDMRKIDFCILREFRSFYPE